MPLQRCDMALRRHGGVDSTVQHCHTLLSEIIATPLHRRALSFAFSECGASAPQVRDMRCARTSPQCGARVMRARRIVLQFVVPVAVGWALGCENPASTRPSTDLLPPLTGDIIVAANTDGSDLDPNGYTATLDLTQSQSLPTNGSTTFSGVLEGAHVVQLSGVASNCTVNTKNPLPVTLVGSSTTATFSVSCTATTGSLKVTTSTTGSDLDPDGYTVVVDGSQSKAIGINSSVTFSGLSPGDHSVQLNGLAQNCTVSSNPRTESITVGNTTTTTFSVSCAPTTGSLAVTTNTTGSNLDPDGYTLTVDWGQSQAIGINNTVTINGLSPGNHSVQLNGLAQNCTVSWNPRTVSITAGSTTTTTFTVSCAATTATGNLTAGNTPTGSNIPTSPYTVTVSGAPGAASQQMPPNGSTTFTGVPPATYTVTLSGQPANCTVSDNNQSVTVQAGQTATVAFTVSCTAMATTGDLTITTSTTGQNIPATYTLNFSGPAGSGSLSIASNPTTTFSGSPSADYTLELDVGATCTVAAPNPRTVTVPPNGATSTTFSVSCM